MSRLFSIFIIASIQQTAVASTLIKDRPNNDSTAHIFSTKKMSTAISACTTMGDGGQAPLWLTANRYGVASHKANSAYERVTFNHQFTLNKLPQLSFEYGADVVLAQNFEYDLMLHQLYAKASYGKFHATIGSQETPIDLRNNELTSGGLGIGINAQPIPQFRISTDYFEVPRCNGWWKMKARCAYGFYTDDTWQKRWLDKRNLLQSEHYTQGALYHEKALYWQFGKEETFPLTFDIGIQMMTQFGGTAHNVKASRLDGNNTYNEMVESIKMPSGPKAFLDALLLKGEDVTDGTYANTAGNTLGSYNMRLQYKGPEWKVGCYFERFFEDQSMLTVQYGIQDHLLGLELEIPENKFIDRFVYEHISTKNQSGAVYHDRTPNLYDKMNGRDNYYNHNIYTGWQHWGFAQGSPLITSPIYNPQGYGITFLNNRVQAHHIGISGNPSPLWHYRVLYTHTDNWGTYDKPFDDVKHQNNWLGEVSYTLPQQGWLFKAALAYDQGSLYANGSGAQITITKTFSIKP